MIASFLGVISACTDDPVPDPYPILFHLVTPSENALTFRWQVFQPLHLIVIVKNPDHIPQSITDGTRIDLEGTTEEWTDTDVSTGETYYYKIYTCIIQDQKRYYSSGVPVKATSVPCGSIDLSEMEPGSVLPICLDEEEQVHLQINNAQEDDRYIIIPYTLPGDPDYMGYSGYVSGSYTIQTETPGKDTSTMTAPMRSYPARNARIALENWQWETLERISSYTTQVELSQIFNQDPEIGEVVSDIIINNPTLSGSAWQKIDAQVVRITNNSVWLLDITNPPNTTDLVDSDLETALDSFVTTLDNLILPVEEDLIGKVPAIVPDRKLYIVLSSAFSNPEYPLIGYFNRVDFFQRTDSNNKSNEAPIIYAARPGYWDAAEVRATTAHELQHLLNYSRMIYENWGEKVDGVAVASSTPAAGLYYNINEGMSYLIEDITGLGETSRGPVYLTQQLLQSSVNYQRSFINSNTSVPLVTRGLFYLFLRYTIEQFDGLLWRGDGFTENKAFWFIQNLLEQSCENFNQFTCAYASVSDDGRDLSQFVGDFLTTLVLDGGDETLNSQPEYNFLSPELYQPTGMIQGIDLTDTRIIGGDVGELHLTGPRFTPYVESGITERILWGGAFDWLEYIVDTNPPEQITITLNMAQVPGTGYARIIRLN